MLTRKSESGTWIAANDTPSSLDPNAPNVLEGERRLMIAVLVHALRGIFRDAEKPGRGALRRLRQDVRWLTSADCTDLFAFERICESIGIDPESVRRYVFKELGSVMQLLEATPTRSRRARASAPRVVEYSEPARAVG
jgi:hypothetical protein